MSSINKIYQGLVFYLFHPFFKVGNLLAGFFLLLPASYKRSIVGTCIIFAPPKQMQTILQGIAFLKEVDLAMYERLTVERKYILTYQKKRRTHLDEFYSVTDDILTAGNEGVAIGLVQIILFRDEVNSLGQFGIDPSKEMAARLKFKQQILEFVKKHSFPVRFIEFYQRRAEMAELEQEKSN